MISSHLWYSTFNFSKEFLVFLFFEKFNCVSCFSDVVGFSGGEGEKKIKSFVFSGFCLKLFCFHFFSGFDFFFFYSPENSQVKILTAKRLLLCVLNIRERTLWFFQFSVANINFGMENTEVFEGKEFSFWLRCLSSWVFLSSWLIKVKEGGAIKVRNKNWGRVEIEAVFGVSHETRDKHR